MLTEHDMADPVYMPMITAMAMELSMAEDAANAIYRPISPHTGKRVKRTLEQYLTGSGPPGFTGVPRNSQTSQELTLLRDSLKQLAKLAAEFGTSPLSKKRLGTGKKTAEESPMMAYIRAANDRASNRRVS